MAGGGKGKIRAVMVHLLSTAGTGYTYTVRKSVKAVTKLELRKYDPRVRQHVIFQEHKIHRSAGGRRKRK